jgi:hypothetical protein
MTRTKVRGGEEASGAISTATRSIGLETALLDRRQWPACRSSVAAMCPERTVGFKREARQPRPSPSSWLGGRPRWADCLALLATWGRLRTLCTRCARSVQTCGAKSVVEARKARCPKSLRCSAPHKSPSNAPGYRALASRTNCPRNRAKYPLRLGSARRRAICARPSAQRSGSGARSALQLLIWRPLLERSEHERTKRVGRR